MILLKRQRSVHFMVVTKPWNEQGRPFLDYIYICICKHMYMDYIYICNSYEYGSIIVKTHSPYSMEYELYIHMLQIINQGQ